MRERQRQKKKGKQSEDDESDDSDIWPLTRIFHREMGWADGKPFGPPDIWVRPLADNGKDKGKSCKLGKPIDIVVRPMADNDKDKGKGCKGAIRPLADNDKGKGYAVDEGKGMNEELKGGKGGPAEEQDVIEVIDVQSQEEPSEEEYEPNMYLWLLRDSEIS